MSSYDRRDSIGVDPGFEGENDDYPDYIDIGSPDDYYPRSAEEDERAIADRVLQEFEEILEAAGRYDFEKLNDRNSFEEKYRGKLNTENKTYGTLIHNFVTSRGRSKQLSFGRWLVKRWPDLVKVQDSDGKTPLHLALDPKHHLLEFVELVLQECPDTTLTAALERRDHGGRNCLHHAISTKFRSTLKLIEKCGPITFTAKNTEGKTPLLMAMDLDYPFRKRLQVSKALPPVGKKKVMAPSNAFSRDPSEPPEKANGYEVVSVDEVENKKDKNTSKKSNETRPKNEVKDKDVLSKNKDALIKPEELSAEKAIAKFANHPRPQQQGWKKPDTGRGGTGLMTSKDRFYLPDIVQSLIKRSKDSMSKANREGQTPYQYRLHLLSTVNGTGAVKDDVVAQNMKEFCLRTLGRQEAIDMLYEKGKGMCFRKPNSILSITPYAMHECYDQY
jgi:hypothetical protein